MYVCRYYSYIFFFTLDWYNVASLALLWQAVSWVISKLRIVKLVFKFFTYKSFQIFLECPYILHSLCVISLGREMWKKWRSLSLFVLLWSTFINRKFRTFKKLHFVEKYFQFISNNSIDFIVKHTCRLNSFWFGNTISYRFFCINLYIVLIYLTL